MAEDDIKDLTDRQLLERILAKLLLLDARTAGTQNDLSALKVEVASIKLGLVETRAELKEDVAKLGDKLDLFGRDVNEVRAVQRGVERRLTSLENRP